MQGESIEKIRKLLPQVDFNRLKFSLLIITAKQEFIDWLTAFEVSKGLGEYKTYFTEEDLVWIIPSLDYHISEPGLIDKFIEEIKPRLLLFEIHQFGANVDDFEHPISKETFDLMFNISIRVQALSISTLLDSNSSP